MGKNASDARIVHHAPGNALHALWDAIVPKARMRMVNDVFFVNKSFDLD